ncbi:TetR/AcrR family transcriptional regulator [Roseibium aggregatum]|uniref:TetR/AcrR family transcriptional regulator n=1 Tax=Roseibium aggregatum TaxID=187304 RepID=UPI001AD8CF92|nr:TetR/AcrR family transcriptional regulator [Roseibium aggregatum]
MDVAFRTFQKHSYKGSTMLRVAANAGISKRTLYEVFPSKPELFTQMAIRHRSNVVDLTQMDEDCPLDIALRKIFKVDQTDAEHQRQIDEMRLFFAESIANPELGDLVRKHCGAGLLDLLADWVDTQKKKGTIVTSSPRDTAKYLMDILVGARLYRPDSPEGPSGISDIRTYLEHSIAHLVHGLQPR